MSEHEESEEKFELMTRGSVTMLFLPPWKLTGKRQGQGYWNCLELLELLSIAFTLYFLWEIKMYSRQVG